MQRRCSASVDLNPSYRSLHHSHHWSHGASVPTRTLTAQTPLRRLNSPRRNRDDCTQPGRIPARSPPLRRRRFDRARNACAQPQHRDAHADPALSAPRRGRRVRSIPSIAGRPPTIVSFHHQIQTYRLIHSWLASRMCKSCGSLYGPVAYPMYRMVGFRSSAVSARTPLELVN